MSINNKRKRKRILFFGDSITEQGARTGGFIKLLEQRFRELQKDEDYQLVGAGVGGNKVTDLFNRLHKDVLYDGADIVVVFIGINDVWHKLNGNGTDTLTFVNTYKTIIEKLLTAGIKVVVCTPTVIGEKTVFSNQQDDDLEKYSSIIRSLADSYNLPLVDLRKTFTDYLLINNLDDQEYGILTTDKVHLNGQGNKLVACEMLEVLEPLCNYQLL